MCSSFNPVIINVCTKRGAWRLRNSEHEFVMIIKYDYIRYTLLWLGPNFAWALISLGALFRLGLVSLGPLLCLDISVAWVQISLGAKIFLLSENR